MDVDVYWIDRLHRKQGYAEIGYNYFYKRDGSKQMGRSLKNYGAHTIGVGDLKGANRYSIGVCYSGGMSEDGKPEDNITVDQWFAILEDFRKAISSLWYSLVTRRTSTTPPDSRKAAEQQDGRKGPQ